MSKTPPQKILIYGINICFAILIIATGCSTHQKKRGIVFRGDWAFEINRTPWIGHPGNTDIPGTEESEDNGSKQKKTLCTRDKKASLTDSLLGPLTSLRSKCRCRDCLASGTGGANINYTSYNPSVANTFPNPIPGAYPGTIPQGSFSLPPGAVVVPNGVIMPNGTLLPHHLFYSQSNPTVPNPGFNPATGQPLQQQWQTTGQGGYSVTAQPFASTQEQQIDPQQGQVFPQIPPQPTYQTLPSKEPGVPSDPPPAVTTSQGVPVQPPPLPLPQLQTPPQLQIPATPALSGTIMPQVATSEAQYAMMQNTMMQNALLQSLNASNSMLVNPAQSQIVPGLSMTGTQAPGYPPIGYAPSGYAPGYAQQMNAPPIMGPMGANTTQQQSLAAQGSAQGRASSTATVEQEDKPELPAQVAAMPYPRHFPVPTRPVYQRQTGISPQTQISQAAAFQEQQMQLERQRQALLMQQNMSVAQSATRQPAKSNLLRRPLAVVDDGEEIATPKAPISSIILANHQTSILQPPAQRTSQVAQTSTTTVAKKIR